ncbi:MAG: UvrD-helicase domain-containing protein [Alistipes sp.]|nr:UvrD-helicase domain-containing protein [Alistipes sp.]
MCIFTQIIGFMTHFKAHILTASAGSGKTYSLAREYIYNALRPQQDEPLRGFNPYIYRTILAVTFTNKATEEMKSRILTQINNLATGSKCEFEKDLIKMTGLSKQALQERAMKVRSAILHDYSRFAVLTNDTFFQRIVRAFVKELGIDINYAIELDSTQIIEKSVETLIGRIDKNPELQQWLLEFAEENISSGKQWNIKKGILRLKNELFKEHTKSAIDSIDREQIKQNVTHYLELAQQQIEAIKQVARDAVALITRHGYTHATFSYSFTSYFDSIINFDQQTKPATQRVIDHCTDNPELWFKKSPKPTADMLSLAAQLQPMLVECVSCYQQLKYLTNSCYLLSKNYRSFALLGDLYNTAKEICQEQNTMLLSETKHTIASFITEQDAPFIYEKVGNRFEKFMIDEFQDTSLKEWENFRPLLMNAISQSADIAVLLVGDIKQSIYRWRGSNWNILNSIAPSDLKRGDTAILQDSLKINFRSLPEVVKFNYDTMRAVADRVNLHLNSTLRSAREAGRICEQCYNELFDALASAYDDSSLKQAHNPFREFEHQGFVRTTAHYSQEPDIVGRVRELVHEKGFKPCDITILVRDRKQAQNVASQLLAAGMEDESMRFGVMTQEALKLGSSPVVKFILAVMKYAVDRRDVVSLALYNYHRHHDLYHKLTDEELAFFDTLRSHSAEVAFEKILIEFAALFDGQSAYIDALHENIIKFCATKAADLLLFTKWWDENSGDKSVTIDKDLNAIEIMTIHKSKGLENKVIIIPYCNWRFIPEPVRPTTIWANPSEDSGFGEEAIFPVQSTASASNSIFAEGYYKEYIYSYIDAINLLYVALTRPREQLHIFFPTMTPDKSGSFDATAETVGQLLFQLFDMKEQYQEVIEGEELPEPITISYGNYEGPEKQSTIDEGTISVADAPTSEYKMKLRLSSRRYSEALECGTISPQDEGIVLHGIMEHARTVDDIYKAIDSLVIDGILSQPNAEALAVQLERVVSTPTAAEWFSSEWEQVHIEGGIIAPGIGTRRPDRVMINGKKAIVVDYKFGEKHNSYRKQIALYCSLLSKMGYSEVKGYLWYVREGEIEEVI